MQALVRVVLGRTHDDEGAVDLVAIGRVEGLKQALEAPLVAGQGEGDGVELAGGVEREGARRRALDAGQVVGEGVARVLVLGAADVDEGLDEEACRERVALVGDAVDERREGGLRRPELAEPEGDRDVAAGQLGAVLGRCAAGRRRSSADGDREGEDRDREGGEHATRDRLASGRRG